MKQKQIFLFAGLVALVAGYAVYDFQQEKRTEQLKDDESRLIYLKAEQINYVEFDTQSGKFTLEKTADGWQVTAPFKDDANSNTVDQFIQALATEKTKEMVDEGNDKSLDYAAFGLDKPMGAITVKDNLGDSRKISVGSIKNFQGDAFVRIDDRNEVAISSSTWFSKIEKKVGDFRDLRFLRSSASKIQSFKLSQNRNVSEIASKDGNWVSTEFPAMKLDQNKVREFVTALTMAEAIEVILDKDISQKQLQAWGLLNPTWKVDVLLSEDKVWQMSIAPEKDKILRAYVKDPEFVLKISPTERDRFSKYNLDRFRDRTEPFIFDKEKVKIITVKNSFKSFELRKSKEPHEALETWKLTGEVPGFSLNQDRIIDLINKLSVFELENFTTLKSHPSLQGAASVIDLKDENDELLISITMSSPAQLIYAKTNKFSEVVTVSHEDYASLKLNELLKSNIPENPKEESP